MFKLDYNKILLGDESTNEIKGISQPARELSNTRYLHNRGKKRKRYESESDGQDTDNSTAANVDNTTTNNNTDNTINDTKTNTSSNNTDNSTSGTESKEEAVNTKPKYTYKKKSSTTAKSTSAKKEAVNTKPKYTYKKKSSTTAKSTSAKKETRTNPPATSTQSKATGKSKKIGLSKFDGKLYAYAKSTLDNKGYRVAFKNSNIGAVKYKNGQFYKDIDNNRRVVYTALTKKTAPTQRTKQVSSSNTVKHGNIDKTKKTNVKYTFKHKSNADRYTNYVLNNRKNNTRVPNMMDAYK